MREPVLWNISQVRQLTLGRGKEMTGGEDRHIVSVKSLKLTF